MTATKVRAGTSAAARRRGGSRSGLPTWALKVVMSVTGLVLGLFVVVHALGNVKVFLGADHVNDYAHWLRTAATPVLPDSGLLWLLRAVLLVCLLLHVVVATVLWRRARTARGPVRRTGLPLRSLTARTMPVTGLVLLGFVVFHVLDLTTGTGVAASGEFRSATSTRSFAYENLVASFRRPLAATAYVVATLALSAHLAHGLSMAVNDLGGAGKRAQATITALSGAAVLVVLLVNVSIPLAVLTGLVG